jgi:predicted DNA-binding antitoxin AbrB/MazE fold protein
MEQNGEIPVIFERGVFRPEQPVDLPEHSRHRVVVRQSESSANGHHPNGLKQTLEGLRARGLIRAGGVVPNRDELHERR